MPENKANKSTKNGDELFIVESSNASPENRSTNWIFHQETSVPDKVRKNLGCIWMRPSSGKQRFLNKATVPLYGFNLLESRRTENEGEFEETLEVLATPNSNVIREVRDFLRENGTTVFGDHATIINTYESESNKVEQAAGMLNLYANVKSDYNFLSKKYEEKITKNSESIKEADLPNFYNFLLRSEGADNILTNGGRISLGEPKGLSNESLKPVSQYFVKWSETFDDYMTGSDYVPNAMKHIYFTSEETDKLDELYKYKELFPMFNTVEFNIENDAKFGTTLEETNFSTQLKNSFTSANRKNVSMFQVRSNMSERIVSQQVTLDDERVVDVESFEEGGTTATSNVGTLSTYDIDNIMENYSPSSGEELTFNNNMRDASRYRAFYSLMSIIVRGRIEKIKKEVFRTYKEILDGKTAYSEPVFYMIEKYDTKPERDNLLQTFTFTNTSKLELIKFVDTQVKYDKRYHYRIKAINLVVGTEYNLVFDSVGRTPEGNTDRVKFKAISRPSVKLVSTILFDKPTLVYDNPPIAPELLVIPFKGVNNRIRFFFNSSVGRYKAKPIFFEDAESEIVENKYKVSQDIPTEQEEIMFETDDSVNDFILYKMKQKPKSYQEFQEMGEIITVSTYKKSVKNSLASQTSRPSSASYDDIIEPNKKYYYCLRAADYHDNISYPSVVYEVELVYDTGSVYPIIRICDMDGEPKKEKRLGVKRFIHILPSYENLISDQMAMKITDDEGPRIGQDVVLGVSDDKVWGKRFKMRLTSKSTGKKVDFNFSFNLRQNSLTIE